MVVKIVIAGGFGAGKTTAVGAVSEITPLSTEEYLTQASADVDSLAGIESKVTTTVAFDFGRLTLPDPPMPMELFLFGTPGQDRFGALWHDLSRGAVGAIVLVDTRRLETSFAPIDFFEHLGLPFVVAVNEFDGAHRYQPDQVRAALRLAPHVPVVTCDARTPAHVAGVLLTLIDHAMRSTPTRQDA
ncbi:ATP/GTP-binding protein [Streptomyces sp. NPDC052299]|uniref:GTP-binding protein n=1 Tax=Streptomyces sp. NPDC052299 TaxID=3155054 RepID=UPI00342ECB5B